MPICAILRTVILAWVAHVCRRAEAIWHLIMIEGRQGAGVHWPRMIGRDGREARPSTLGGEHLVPLIARMVEVGSWEVMYIT